MPDVSTITVATEPVASTPPGWVAGLPDTLKANESLTKFKTVGDLASDYLATSTKAQELEGRIGNSIPKLKENATDEERGQFYDALGRPKDAKEYEFDGEDKNAPEWTNQWKQEFHSLGLTKAQAKALSGKWNATMQSMVEAHNAKLTNEMATAQAALKSEWGDKFDTNVELAKRVYQKHIGTEFDKDFDAGTGTTRLQTMRLIMKFAALTGEDRSPQGTNGLPAKGEGNPYPNSKMQPART
jgi:hypothetical protein